MPTTQVLKAREQLERRLGKQTFLKRRWDKDFRQFFAVQTVIQSEQRMRELLQESLRLERMKLNSPAGKNT
jgi:hypothetical protein